MHLTKIVCTLGPTSWTPEQVEALARAGMNVARINMSHGNWEQHLGTIRMLKELNKKLAKESGIPTSIGIMLDSKGAEVRTGIVEKPLVIAKDEEVIFSSKELKNEKRQVVTINYDGFSHDVKEAEYILLDNGKLLFDLVKVEKDGRVVARARENGTIGSRRHVNLPGANLGLPSITDKDWEDIKNAAAEGGIDFLALSFIREGKEVEEVREYLKKKKSDIQLITKIETRQAVQNMAGIIEASDGIMVARGDLGSEVPFEQIPVIQDELVAQSREAGKPVIVATHMLESMIDNPMPTRAEVTDIAHAAVSRTDSTMLSGETASGKFPIGSLEAMARVLTATEKHLAQSAGMSPATVRNEREARAQAAVTLALSTNAAALVVMTRTGSTARDVSRFRPRMPIIAFTPSEDVQRKLQLSFGVIPVVSPFSSDPEQSVADALPIGKKAKVLKKGDVFVLVSDTKAHDLVVRTVQLRTVN